LNPISKSQAKYLSFGDVNPQGPIGGGGPKSEVPEPSPVLWNWAPNLTRIWVEEGWNFGGLFLGEELEEGILERSSFHLVPHFGFM